MSIVNSSLDDYFKGKPVGSVRRAVTNHLYGINHQQTKTPVPDNKDLYGYTFFVRPQLNLASNNIRPVRVLNSLLSTNPTSIQRFVRTTLDPRLMHGDTTAPLTCPLVDPLQAFIPVLSNSLISMSGWPDIVAPTFTSKPGLYKEQYSQVDGTTDIYESFDVDLSFKNSVGDPIIYLFYMWLKYSSAVFEGSQMYPYPDFIRENEIDYNTRVYRLVMDGGRRYVRKIAATGAAFPLNVPTGQFFDYNIETPYNNQVNTFTIRLRALGAIYQDSLLIHEFNSTVKIFNPDMRDANRESRMSKIPAGIASLFNNKGYCLINETTHELEWFVRKELVE